MEEVRDVGFSVRNDDLSLDSIEDYISKTKLAMQTVFNRLRDLIKLVPPDELASILKHDRGFEETANELKRINTLLCERVKAELDALDGRRSEVAALVNELKQTQRHIDLVKIARNGKKAIRKFGGLRMQSCDDLQKVMKYLRIIDSCFADSSYQALEELQDDRTCLAEIRAAIHRFLRQKICLALQGESGVRMSSVGFIINSNMKHEKEVFSVIDHELRKLDILFPGSANFDWLVVSEEIKNFKSFSDRVFQLDKFVVKRENAGSASSFTDDQYLTYLVRQTLKYFQESIKKRRSFEHQGFRKIVEENYPKYMELVYHLEQHFLALCNQGKCEGVAGETAELSRMFVEQFENNYLKILSSRLNKCISSVFSDGFIATKNITGLVTSTLERVESELSTSVGFGARFADKICLRVVQFAEVVNKNFEKLVFPELKGADADDADKYRGKPLSISYIVISLLIDSLQKVKGWGLLVNNSKLSAVFTNTLETSLAVKQRVRGLLTDSLDKVVDLPAKILLSNYSQSSRVIISKLNVSYIIVDAMGTVTKWKENYKDLGTADQDYRHPLLHQALMKLTDNMCTACLSVKITSSAHKTQIVSDVNGLEKLVNSLSAPGAFQEVTSSLCYFLSFFPDKIGEILTSDDFSLLKVDKCLVVYFVALNFNTSPHPIYHSKFSTVHEAYFWFCSSGADERCKVVRELVENAFEGNHGIKDAMIKCLSGLIIAEPSDRDDKDFDPALADLTQTPVSS